MLAERALPYAAALAGDRHAPLPLVPVVAMHDYGHDHGVVSLSGMAATDLVIASEEEEETRYLERQAADLHRLVPGLTIQTELRVGEPAPELLAAEQAHDAQVVVLTTHGHTGVLRWLHGSVADRVAHVARVPVLLYRPVQVDASRAA